jgi:ssDNA-binding Zn-finger/Zn-ribbon topoisomerase 1
MNLVPILILLLFFLFIGFLKNKIKGKIGEKTIATILGFLNKSNYKVINNILLKSGEKTSQIDHLVISDFGIFVIETKNYKGWILGDEHSEYWTQVIYKRRERLYNPIKQNLGHIRAVKNCLIEYPNLKYISIVVFLSKAELKVNTNTHVIYSHQLIKTIKKYSDINLTETEKETIFHKIKACNLIDTYDKREHVKSIKQRILKRENAIRENKCPQCGNKLAMRSGKFGKFLGCYSYPQCKFIRNI